MQKSPMYTPKEPYICTKRALYVHLESPVYMQESLIYTPEVAPDVAGNAGLCKRALCTHQKSPIYTPKEPCVLYSRCRWQGRFMQKSHVYTPKETCVYVTEPYAYTKRALCTHQKSPVYIPKETCVYVTEPYAYTKRALYIHQKSPVYTPKETCVYITEPYAYTKMSRKLLQILLEKRVCANEPYLCTKRALFTRQIANVYTKRAERVTCTGKASIYKTVCVCECVCVCVCVCV